MSHMINSGDVRGPIGSTLDDIAVFADASGKVLKDGGQTIAQVIAGLSPAFTPVTFAAGDYTGNNSMTWTVASNFGGAGGHYRYSLNGKLLTISFKIGGTVGGTPSTKLQVKLPNGLISKNSVNFIASINSLGTGFQFGFANVAAAGTTMDFQTSLASPFANWGAGAAEVDFLGSIEIQ